MKHEYNTKRSKKKIKKVVEIEVLINIVLQPQKMVVLWEVGASGKIKKTGNSVGEVRNQRNK